MNSKFITHTNLKDIYTNFKKDFMNVELTVQDLRNKYSLSRPEYDVLRQKVCEETGMKKKKSRTQYDVKPKRIILTKYSYLRKHPKGYFIQKKIQGQRKSFGLYPNIETAQYVRNQLLKNNWDNKLAETLKQEYSVSNSPKLDEALKKYPIFKELYVTGKSVNEIKETLHLTQYQYNNLARKINNEKKRIVGLK